MLFFLIIYLLTELPVRSWKRAIAYVVILFLFTFFVDIFRVASPPFARRVVCSESGPRERSRNSSVRIRCCWLLSRMKARKMIIINKINSVSLIIILAGKLPPNINFTTSKCFRDVRMGWFFEIFSSTLLRVLHNVYREYENFLSWRRVQGTLKIISFTPKRS